MMSLSPQRLEAMASELAARSDQDITEAIQQYDTEDRISIRHAIDAQREALGLTMDASAAVPGRRLGEQDGSYWLSRMNVRGPIAQQELENRMAAERLEPRIRIECKVECMERGWLSRGVGYRVSAAGALSTDQDGRPLGRLATDDATVSYGPRPLSLEMSGLFRRVGLEEDRLYRQDEVDQALWTSDLDVTQRLAVRGELSLRRQLQASGRDTLDERLSALRVQLRQLRRF